MLNGRALHARALTTWPLLSCPFNTALRLIVGMVEFCFAQSQFVSLELRLILERLTVDA